MAAEVADEVFAMQIDIARSEPFAQRWRSGDHFQRYVTHVHFLNSAVEDRS
jgi:hypothetical protein